MRGWFVCACVFNIRRKGLVCSVGCWGLQGYIDPLSSLEGAHEECKGTCFIGPRP